MIMLSGKTDDVSQFSSVHTWCVDHDVEHVIVDSVVSGQTVFYQIIVWGDYEDLKDIPLDVDLIPCFQVSISASSIVVFPDTSVSNVQKVCSEVSDLIYDQVSSCLERVDSSDKNSLDDMLAAL